jgi:superoxide reductase
MLEIYKCEHCGKVVMIADEGAGRLVCCGKPMAQQTENTVDASTEKHVPVIEKTPDGIMVKIGTFPHPMEANHYIKWIEVISGPYLYVKGFKPGEKPEVSFPIPTQDLKVRTYCNLHGVWSNKPHRT